jgi:antitoxin (DNA-binding transcriptional repressor) of toxin-antitoxin stability system
VAGKEEIVVTVHGHPIAVIIGFENEDDWLEYRLSRDDKFLARVAESRQQCKEGKYEALDESPWCTMVDDHGQHPESVRSGRAALLIWAVAANLFCPLYSFSINCSGGTLAC